MKEDDILIDTYSQKEFQAEADAGNTQPKKQGGALREIFSWIKVIVFAAVIAFVINNYVIVNATVPTGSMENTIMPDNRIIGLRFSYWFSNPERGDIVIFKYPVNETENYIKRIIGLPGETIEIREGKIYIDGSDTPLDEPYLKEEWTTENDGYIFHVPEDCYLMLGDNRNGSSDARFWAEKAMLAANAKHQSITEEEAEAYSYVKKSKILGKAVARYWPKASLLK